MAAAPPQLQLQLPLHELVANPRIQTHQRYAKSAFILRSLLLLFLLLPLRSSYYYHHLHLHLHLHHHHDMPRLHLLLLATALLCELWLSFQAHLALVPRLRLIQRLVHPSRLLLLPPATHGHGPCPLQKLPPVDVFVTTADPLKEPPIVTLNTLLSALALDYSPRRLACYVSDDGGSILNLWAIKLAAAFARDWVPFCRRFRFITPRAPGPHFANHRHAPPPHTHSPNASSSSSSSSDAVTEFAAEWTAMKAKYTELERRVTSMTQRYGDHRWKAEALKIMLADVMMDAGCTSSSTLDLKKDEGYMGRLKRSVLSESWAAADYDSRHHHAYCEVLIDKSEEEEEEEEEGLPCLVYMSREKSLQRKHHYKAGNMNALIRVSGIFTNAPFTLNLDCDTYATDGKALLQAMCFFMDPAINPQLGFVQFPQIFEGMDGDNTFVATLEVLFKGWDGAQGPSYSGTSCVHKREVLYGKTPDGICVNSLESKDLGASAQFISCAARILSTNPSDDGKNHGVLRGDPFVEEAIELLGCRYEDGTNWGKEVGLLYGSVTEDALTGLKLHGMGWKSVFCSPKDAAFLGGLPTTIEEVLKTRKRWSTGVLEIMVGTNSPFSFTRLPKLSLIQRLNYICLGNSFAVAIPLATYALLPCTSLLIGRPLFPKMEENPMLLLLGLAAFVSAYGCTYVESMIWGVSLQAWWMGEKMEALAATSSSLCAAYDVLKKIVGISDTKFDVTSKDKLVKEEHEKTKREETEEAEEKAAAEVRGGLVVNSKLRLFVPPTVIVMLNLAALSQFLLSSLLTPSLWSSTSSSAIAGRVHAVGHVVMKVEAWCCAWVLLLLHPIVKGLLLWCRGHRRSPLALHSSVVFLSSFCSFIALCILMMGKSKA